jgi:precorrin-6B methylase 2
MIKRLKESVWILLRHLRISYLISLTKPTSYLRNRGWLNSILHNRALSQDGKPVPWLTYPFVDFIAPRLNKSHEIFEFGGGNSTLFWSNLVGSVDAIDHDKKWVEMISKQLPTNGKIVYVEVENIHYTELAFQPIGKVNTYNQWLKNNAKRYDIIIVDGVDRNNCILNAVNALKEGGIIVIDNMELESHMQIATDNLTTHGFKRLDFWGMAPLLTSLSCTSIFYKTNNCLNI